MSRRQVSIKDLGVADCQGWLHRRKEGCSFLGSKWKKYWFVLKKCSLYWYADRMADKADGFINVSGFTIEQAKHCRKKHAIIATHPLVVTIFFAAESFIEMNKWITNLSEAAKQHEVINTEECYSESSDQEGDEPVSTCSQDSEQGTTESENGDVSEPLCESSSCPSIPLSMTATENRRINTSDGGTLSRNKGRRAASEGGERLSWQDVSRPDGAAPTIQLEEKEEDDIHERPPDELEHLYNHLKAASLSPVGLSAQRDFRASFIRRSHNDKVNEKLHQLRILNSTLKAREAALRAVEQILNDPSLTALTYREWRLSNLILLQEISHRSQAAGGATV